MKKNIIVLLIALVAVSLFVGCKKEPEIKTYKVGDKGPAGGWIFYDCDADNDVEYTAEDGTTKKNKDGLTSAECGWRYLEAASADLAATLSWGPSGSSYSTGTGIGTGKSNTDKLIAASGQFPAAEACANYSEGGYDDWFLPSLDELGLMYTNLKLESKGGTWQSDELYWSSSEGNSGNAWSLYFFNKHQDSNFRSNSFYVRPIRAFK